MAQRPAGKRDGTTAGRMWLHLRKLLESLAPPQSGPGRFTHSRPRPETHSAPPRCVFKRTVSACYTSEDTKDVTRTWGSASPPRLQPPPHGALLSESGTPRLVSLLSQLRAPPPARPRPSLSPLPPPSAPPDEGRAPCSRGPVHSSPAGRLGHRLTVIADNQNRLLCPEPPRAPGAGGCDEQLHSAPGRGAEARAAPSGNSGVTSSRQQ